MKEANRTKMGGENTRFAETEWTRISQARTENEARRREAVSAICSRYWKPVCYYLLRKGYDNEQAKDLTQGFFEEIVLGRDLIQKADKGKGKFRTLLLTALDRHVVSRHRAASAKKRSPGKRLASLDQLEGWEQPKSLRQATPEEAYAYAWAAGLLDEALKDVEAHCRQAGQDKHWEVFRRAVLEPLWTNIPPEPLSVICHELGIRDEARASNMCVTVKRRFKTTLRLRIRPSVGSEKLVDEEIQDLMRILSKGSAGP